MITLEKVDDTVPHCSEVTKVIYLLRKIEMNSVVYVIAFLVCWLIEFVLFRDDWK